MPSATITRRDMARARGLAIVALAAVSLAACVSGPDRPDLAASAPPVRGADHYRVGKPYQVNGIWYTPREQPDYDEVGLASWYGPQFQNHSTANGEVFDMARISAAHKTLPLPSLVEVTNLNNGRKLVVRVNDRGPFVGARLIDLSKAAAEELGYASQGVTRVRVRYVGRAPLTPEDGRLYVASAAPPRAPPRPAATRPVAVDEYAVAGWPGVQPPIKTTTAALTTAASVPAGAVANPPSATPLAPAVEHAPAAFAEAESPAPLVQPPASEPAPTAPASASAPASAVGELADAAVAGGHFSVQAGAYANWDNAHRAAEVLATAGHTQVQSFDRAGARLYRVLVDGFSDEGQAWDARERVVRLGFGDARVVGGS